MKPKIIGRTLGIGMRVAARMAGQRMSAAGAQAGASQAARGSSQSGAPTRTEADYAARGRATGQAAKAGAKGLARGVGGFLRPFGRVGGILWLEVTGVFFLVFVVAFAPTLWRTRASFAHGPDHRTFLVTAVVMAVFLYLSVSSFWRARKR